MTLSELKAERNKASAALVGAVETLLEHDLNAQCLKPYVARYDKANEAVKREIVRMILEGE